MSHGLASIGADNTQPWDRPDDESDYCEQRTVDRANRATLVYPEDLDNCESEMVADAQSHHCVLCFGPLVTLGILGRLHWSRCRQCGAQYSHSV